MDSWRLGGVSGRIAAPLELFYPGNIAFIFYPGNNLRMTDVINHPHTRSTEARRELSRQARDAFPPMGVFAIKDSHTGRVTVGSSRNVHAALNRIQFELKLGSHPDRDLQSIWRHDPSRLVFQIVEMVRQRAEPDFDYTEELRLLECLHREELRKEAL
jgi:hypothetical protein